MAATTNDIEAASVVREYLPGFADFSHFIASDYSLSIYRKFATLGARNLLYLQAELQLLERRLHDLDEGDQLIIELSDVAEEKQKVESGARSWEDLEQQAEDGDQQQAEKLNIIYKIRKLMQEYGK